MDQFNSWTKFQLPFGTELLSGGATTATQGGGD